MQKFKAGSLLLAGIKAKSRAKGYKKPANNSLELPNIAVIATRSEVAKNQLSVAAIVYTFKEGSPDKRPDHRLLCLFSQLCSRTGNTGLIQLVSYTL